MNPKRTPANHAMLHPVGERQRATPDAAFNAEFQELSGLGMDRALGLQKASLAAAVRLQSELIESYKTASWCTPELADWLDNLAHAFANCMELQMNLFALMGTQVRSSIASLPGMNPEMAVKVLERSMDIALGSRKAV